MFNELSDDREKVNGIIIQKSNGSKLFKLAEVKEHKEVEDCKCK